jgi:hypothetical protein
MKQIVGLISEAAAVTAEAVPLLRNVSRNATKLHVSELTREHLRKCLQALGKI